MATPSDGRARGRPRLRRPVFTGKPPSTGAGDSGALQLSVLGARKWTIAAITAAVLFAAMALSFHQSPVYVSTATVLVGASAQQSTQAQPNMATEKDIASSTSVAGLVVHDLSLPVDAKTLLKDLSVDVPVDSDILEFHVAGATPRGAQERAQAFADAYLAFRQQQLETDLANAQKPLKDRIDTLTGQVRAVQRQGGTTPTSEQQAQISSLLTQIAILEQKMADLVGPAGLSAGSIVQRAPLPTSPARPNHTKDAILALIVGAMLGVGGAFLHDRLDDRIRGRIDFEDALEAPALGTIPRVPKAIAERGLLALVQPEPLAAEGFRRFAATFVVIAARLDARTIVVTSPRQGEGKSFVTANFGMALARAGKSVLLVSADLHQPAVERYFDCPTSPGLTNILMEPSMVTDAVQASGVPNLFLLPSGSPAGNPTELLGAADVRGLVSGLKEMVDFVLFDTPPILAVSDAGILASCADAVLMVSRERTTTRGGMHDARRELEAVSAFVIGGVLVGTHEKQFPRYPYAEDAHAANLGASVTQLR